MAAAKTVDEYIERAEQWRAELARLRDLLAKTELEETIKWGAPCYVLDGTHVVGLAAFKSYVGLWFHQGALLSDPDGVLVNAQDGKTKALRQWRFTSGRDIKVRAIRRYVDEAIEHARAGRAIAPKRGRPIDVPIELSQAFARDAEARAAFDALTPGRRREYAEHVDSAKREATRASRVEKILPMIRAGKGLHDKYRC